MLHIFDGFEHFFNVFGIDSHSEMVIKPEIVAKVSKIVWSV